MLSANIQCIRDAIYSSDLIVICLTPPQGGVINSLQYTHTHTHFHLPLTWDTLLTSDHRKLFGCLRLTATETGKKQTKQEKNTTTSSGGSFVYSGPLFSFLLEKKNLRRFPWQWNGRCVENLWAVRAQTPRFHLCCWRRPNEKMPGYDHQIPNDNW